MSSSSPRPESERKGRKEGVEGRGGEERREEGGEEETCVGGGGES